MARNPPSSASARASDARVDSHSLTCTVIRHLTTHSDRSALRGGAWEKLIDGLVFNLLRGGQVGDSHT